MIKKRFQLYIDSDFWNYINSYAYKEVSIVCVRRDSCIKSYEYLYQGTKFEKKILFDKAFPCMLDHAGIHGVAVSTRVLEAPDRAHNARSCTYIHANLKGFFRARGKIRHLSIKTFGTLSVKTKIFWWNCRCSKIIGLSKRKWLQLEFEGCRHFSAFR